VTLRPEPEQFASVPLFASLTPEQREAMASLTELRSEPMGAQLIGEGAPGYSLFILLDGTATVTATSAVTLAVMFGSDFRVFERDFPEAVGLMKRAMDDRLSSN
jgi:signal-transduction protein with cAMP-binding, CBS, and nucleotidyltransferase domain